MRVTIGVEWTKHRDNRSANSTLYCNWVVPRIEFIKSKPASTFIKVSYVEALSRYYFFRSMTYTTSRPAYLHNFIGCHLNLKTNFQNSRFSIKFTFLQWHIFGEIIMNESVRTECMQKYCGSIGFAFKSFTQIVWTRNLLKFSRFSVNTQFLFTEFFCSSM